MSIFIFIIIGCVFKYWLKFLKNIFVIFKFLVCKLNFDIENVIDLEENKLFINRGKNVILVCNYYILWFVIMNLIYLM